MVCKLEMIKRTLILFILLLILSTVNPVQAFLKEDSSVQMPADPPKTSSLLGNVAGTLTTQPFLSQFAPATGWDILLYEKTKTVSRSYGPPLDLGNIGNTENAIADAALEFANTWSGEFGFGISTPTIYSIKQALNWTIIHIQPEIDGVPVYDSFLILSINQFGKLASLKAQGFGSETVGTFSISSVQAISIAQKAFPVERKDCMVKQVYMPFEAVNKTINLRCAYEIKITSSDPRLQPTLFVSAETGEIIASENRVMFDDMVGRTQGMYYPMYGRDDLELDAFQNEWVGIEGVDTLITDDDGTFVIEVDPQNGPFTINNSLRGQWVETVRFPDEITTSFSFETEDIENVEITWDDNNSFSDEQNLYWHVNFIHDYWKTIENEFDDLDYPLTAGCNLGGEGWEDYEDNAFSTLGGIYFGRGNRYDNFAHYADVIWHEYGHSVTGEIYGWGGGMLGGEGGAMNEAWADYFGCSISDESLIGEGGLMGNRFMRNLDNNRHYPEDIRDEVHYDGLIISGAMWHSREVLGQSYCDSLFHFARYHGGRDFRSYFLDVLLTDDDDGDISNGSPNYRVLYDQFQRHGIDLGEFPHFTFSQITIADDDVNGAEGNNNGIWEPGETIRIDFDFFRNASNGPTENIDVFAMLETNSEFIELVENDRNIGEVQVGKVAELPESFLFIVNENAPVGYADLFLTIYTGNEEYPGRDSLHITIGMPPVLLVKDGDSKNDRTSFYTDALDDINLKYTEFGIPMMQQPLQDQLNLFETVIWFTGDDYEGILNEEDRAGLTEYLANGNNLLLTGQSAGSVPEAEDFFNNVLFARNTIDSVRGVAITGVEGDPISNDFRILLIGDGARNQRRPGAIEAIAPAVECFHWDRVENNPAAGLRYENEESGSKSVYLSFGVEAASSNGGHSPVGEVLTSILSWFEVLNAPQLELLPPGAFQIDNPYPNPFNSLIKLPVHLSQSGHVNLSVYDITGRSIWSSKQLLNIGLTTIPIDANSWSTGKYILKIDNTKDSKVMPIILVK